MKKTVLGLIICLLVSPFLTFSVHAESLDGYTSNESVTSSAETKELYYEEGPLKIYIGQLTEVEGGSNPRPRLLYS